MNLQDARSAAIRHGARQTMAWLHGWSGLLLGWVLFVMALCGSLSVFKPEIGEWMRPEATAKADPVDAVSAAVGWLQGHAAGASGWYLTAPNDRMNTVAAQWAAGDGFLYRALDPLTGAPVARQTKGGEFFYRLHFELQLPYPWGRWIASISAMAMLVALISGIIAHRRIFCDFFTFRPGKGQRSWLDAHNALGVFALPFHIMITFTGLVTLASLTMPWPIAANYGRDMTAMLRAFSPGDIDRPAAAKPAPLAPIAPMLREAEHRFASGVLGTVSIVNPGDAAAVVQVREAGDRQFSFNPHTISFDGSSGRILADWEEKRPAHRTYNVVYGLHLAEFAPPLLRWLYFLGGLLLTGAIGTGMVLWVVKRREKAPLSFGNRIVERLNVGVIGGVPIAAMAYFWANRLLPLGLAERESVEIATVFWTGAICVVAGALLPPRRGWPLLLGVAAIACVGAPWLGGFAPRGVLLDGDALMTAFGGLFLWSAIRAAMPKRAPKKGRR